MRLKDLGEFEIIERIKRKARFNKGVFLGPGDDCAVLEFDSKRFQLFTCDMIIEDVDFRLREDPYRQESDWGIFKRYRQFLRHTDSLPCFRRA